AHRRERTAGLELALGRRVGVPGAAHARTRRGVAGCRRRRRRGVAAASTRRARDRRRRRGSQRAGRQAARARRHHRERARVSMDVETYVRTRESLHALAEHVLSAARYRATGKIGLRATSNGFGTPPFGDDEQLRIDGTTLVHTVAGTDTRTA